jgi:hypothetical protein
MKKKELLDIVGKYVINNTVTEKNNKTINVNDLFIEKSQDNNLNVTSPIEIVLNSEEDKLDNELEEVKPEEVLEFDIKPEDPEVDEEVETKVEAVEEIKNINLEDETLNIEFDESLNDEDIDDNDDIDEDVHTDMDIE